MTGQHSLQGHQRSLLIGLSDRCPQHSRSRLCFARGGTLRSSRMAHLLVLQVEFQPILQGAEGLSRQLWEYPVLGEYQV